MTKQKTLRCCEGKKLWPALCTSEDTRTNQFWCKVGLCEDAYVSFERCRLTRTFHLPGEDGNFILPEMSVCKFPLVWATRTDYFGLVVFSTKEQAQLATSHFKRPDGSDLLQLPEDVLPKELVERSKAWIWWKFNSKDHRISATIPERNQYTEYLMVPLVKKARSRKPTSQQRRVIQRPKSPPQPRRNVTSPTSRKRARRTTETPQPLKQISQTAPPSAIRPLQIRPPTILLPTSHPPAVQTNESTRQALKSPRTHPDASKLHPPPVAQTNSAVSISSRSQPPTFGPPCVRSLGENLSSTMAKNNVVESDTERCPSMTIDPFQSDMRDVYSVPPTSTSAQLFPDPNSMDCTSDLRQVPDLSSSHIYDTEQITATSTATTNSSTHVHHGGPSGLVVSSNGTSSPVPPFGDVQHPAIPCQQRQGVVHSSPNAFSHGAFLIGDPFSSNGGQDPRFKEIMSNLK